MPLVELNFMHPNSGGTYHSELWEVDDKVVASLQELLQRDDVEEEFLSDGAFDEDSLTSNEIKAILSEGQKIAHCEPRLTIDVYWQVHGDCLCEDP